MDMKTCPNCGTTNSNGRDYEYWCLVRRFESLATDTGSIRDLVALAQNRLRVVATGVSRGDSVDMAHQEDWEHIHTARRLLDAAAAAKRDLK